jgi:hypothetical protein
MRFLAVLALAAGFSSPAWAATQPAEPFGTALAAFIAAPASVAAVLLFLQVPVLGLFQRFGNWFSIAIAVTLCAGLCGPVWAASDGIRPDPVLTPGAIRTTSRDEICGTKTGTVRNVSGSLKLQVYRRYGMTGPTAAFPGTDLLPPYEVDHLVSLELGGSNDITNLWPEAYDQPMGAHAKDALENRLHRLICAGRIEPEEAQRAIATDWVAAYAKYVGEAE